MYMLVFMHFVLNLLLVLCVTLNAVSVDLHE